MFKDFLYYLKGTILCEVIFIQKDAHLREQSGN